MAGAEAARWAAVSDSLWQAVGSAQAMPATFSANYQLEFKERPASGTGGKSVRLSGQVRLSADSVLWLSAGMFGLEAFRVWLKQDSIWMVNRLESAAEVYALSVWRNRWPFLALGAQAERRFVTAVLLGLIPDVLQRAEVVYMERRPAAAGGAEVLRFRTSAGGGAGNRLGGAAGLRCSRRRLSSASVALASSGNLGFRATFADHGRSFARRRGRRLGCRRPEPALSDAGQPAVDLATAGRIGR